MKRAIIVHCWGGSPEYCWYPWVKKELEKRGFQVQIPAFPDTDEPKFEPWIEEFQKAVGKPDEELYLIGHSLGCITIMRYLETLGEKEKIGGAVLVAGFSEDIGLPEIKSFLEIPVDYEKVKNSVKNKITAIFSDNDPYVDLKFADIFKKKLDAKVIVKHKAGHFSGAVEGEKTCLKLPEVVENIK